MNHIVISLERLTSPYLNPQIGNMLISFTILTFFPIIYIAISFLLSYLLGKIIRINPFIVILFIIISIFGGGFYECYFINKQNIKSALLESFLGVIWPTIVCIVACGTSGTMVLDSTKKQPNIFEKMSMDIKEDNSVSYSKKDYQGNTVFYNKNGMIAGKGRKGNIDGQIIYEDKDGNIKGESAEATSKNYRIYRKK